MPPNLSDRMISDHEYRQRIRRYRPSSLLPLIAAAAAAYGSPERPRAWLDPRLNAYTPWALADVARVSLVSGNEYRAEATTDDLAVLLAHYAALDDPFGTSGDPAHDVLGFLLRTSGEQLTWQESDKATLARTAALFSQTPPTRPLKCITAGWDQDVLGCSLSDYVGTAQTLWGAAVSNAGRFDPAQIDAELAAHLDIPTVTSILDTHFATDTDGFRAEELGQAEQRRQAGIREDPQLRRFEYNPLRGRPALTGFGPGYLCPVPGLVWAKASPTGVYFTGFNHFGSDFTNDLGDLFEQYVGRQLRLISGATVIPEITYKQDGNTKRSIDWFIVFDKLVLLVEVKSTMPNRPVRLGSADAIPELAKKLEKAYSQIDNTAALIANQHPDFAAIPTDRPVLGMIVTLEPFHFANSTIQRQHLTATTTRTVLAGISELEHLVCVDDIGVADLLLARDADQEQSTWSLHGVLQGHSAGPNPVLDAGWDTYPWASANRGRRTTAANNTEQA
ncbi:hypothetical protein [Catenulispora subtropica]|uniref:NERD domain-containing protein n=1 Tax=Catenulispora subtropica TaxID=450798 RepID=A0ABN2RB91_9ACTN